LKKLIVLTSILAVLVLLVGCIPQEGAMGQCKAPYKQIGEKCCLDENNNNICDSDESAGTTPAPGQPVSGQALMGQFKAALDSQGGYTYKYGEDTYKVYETTVKKELAVQKKIKSEAPVGPKNIAMPWIDVVYFDTSSGKAAAYCEGLNERAETLCSGFELWDVEIPVEYSAYYEKTPTDWLVSFLGKEPAEIKEKYRFEIPGLEVTGIVFVEEGKTTMLDIDPETGLVWKATVDEDGYVTEYAYSDFTTGTGMVAHEYKQAPPEGKTVPAAGESAPTGQLVE